MPKVQQPEGTLDSVAAARYLGCSLGTLRNWTSQQRVPHFKIGSLVRFRQEDLEEWLHQRRVPAK